MNATKRILALTARNLKEILRDRISLIFLFAMPAVMLVLFYYLFSSATDQFKMEYLAPAMTAFAAAFLALFLGLLVSLDRGTSFMIRLYTTRVRPVEFILSYAAAMLPVGAAQIVLLLAIGCLIDPALFSMRLLPALVAGMIVELLYIFIGILIGSLVNEKSVGGVSSVLIAGQSVLSGMWFPPQGLSDGFVRVMNALPFRNASLLMQNVVSGGEILKPLLILLGYTVAVALLSVAVYRMKMKQY